MEKIKIKIKNKGMILIALAILLFLYIPVIYAEETWKPQKTLTIQQFLVDMKANPQNYYVIINRSQEEINALMANTSLASLLSTFNVPVSSYFRDDCKNFILIEIPTTELGKLFGLQKTNSYISLYQDTFLIDQSYKYYLANNWCTFNYTFIYLTPQPLAIDWSTTENVEASNEKMELVNSNNDGSIDPLELVFYYLDNIIARVDNYTNDPINTRNVVVDGENNILDLPIERENFCEGYDYNNTIFKNYTYQLPSLDFNETCLNSTVVLELVCNAGGSVLFEPMNCPSGYYCYSGACLTIPILDRPSIFVLILRFFAGNARLDEVLQSLLLWINN